MIDFHCHLDLYPDPHRVVAAAHRRRLYVLSVTTVPSAFEGTAALVPAGSRIQTALGLHPELAARRAHEMGLFEKLLPRTRYVGEVGLDGSRDHRGSLDLQRDVLCGILRLCTRAGGRILTLHSRGAAGALLDLLAAEPGAGKFVLHWFLGSARQIERAAAMGCWFSVNPTMLQSASGRAAVAVMPPDRVVPESDGPFGQVNEVVSQPWNAWDVVPHLAAVWGTTPDEAATRLRASFKDIVG